MNIENRLRDTLSRRAGAFDGLDESAWAAIEQRSEETRRPHLPSRLGVAFLALGLTVGSMGWLWVALGHGSRTPTPTDPRMSTGPTKIVALPSTRLRTSATIPVGSFTSAVAIGEGFVWAGVQAPLGDVSPWAVAKMDPRSNEMVDLIDVPGAVGVAVGEGGVWVASDRAGKDAVIRIDPGSDRIVATIPVGEGVSGVRVGLGAVWVTLSHWAGGPSGEVLRIDPTTNDIIERIATDEGWPRDIAIGEDAVWVYGHSERSGDVWQAASLWKVDPRTGAVEVLLEDAGLPTDGAFLPSSVSAGDGAVWVADDHGNGVRVDPASGDTTTFSVEGGFTTPFGVYSGSVWYLSGRRLAGLDAETLQPSASYRVGVSFVDVAIDQNTGSFWVGTTDGTVTRLDPL